MNEQGPVNIRDHASPTVIMNEHRNTYHQTSSTLIMNEQGPHNADRFIRSTCAHRPNCTRTVHGTQNAVCTECASEDPVGITRGCRQCRAPHTVNALMASTHIAAVSPQSTPDRMSVASQATTVSPTQRQAFEQNLNDTVASMLELLRTAPDGRVAQDTCNDLRAVCEHLTFVSSEDTTSNLHERQAEIEATPVMVVCARCEQEGHSRPGCRRPCARCGTAWPDCHENCPMRLDASTEFMMAINTDQQHPRVQTLDLDNNEHYTPVAGPLVAAAIPCNASPDLIPDGEAINRYSTVLQQRFADRFPQVEGMNAPSTCGS